jgi:photosystem II stability/assembly factor-like uncharacterized protein
VTARAATAPVLEPGVWKNMGPTAVPFRAGDDPAFTQGMALDPCDPNVLYLCTDGFNPESVSAGLYKTVDGGTTWKKIGQLDEPIRVRIDPQNTQHLYAVDGVRGGTQGFWHSEDGGETWAQQQSFKDWAQETGSYDVYDIAPDPADFKHFLLSFHSPWHSGDAGVVESKDAGETWITHAAAGTGGAGMSIAFLKNSETWLLGTQSAGYWRTANSGEKWDKVSNTNIQHGGGTIYYSKSGVLYASGSPTNLRSLDDGLTFSPINKNSGYTAIFGDGTTLYTAPCFGPSPFLVSPETDGETWTDQNEQTFVQGPFEMAFDHENGIVYNASWNAGMWALKVKQ